MAILSGSVAGAGSSQATATEVTSRFVSVTGADSSVGVRLSGATPGAEFHIYNATATNGLKVYPHVGGNVNGGTTDAAVSIEGKTLGWFVCIDGTVWAAQYTADT